MNRRAKWTLLASSALASVGAASLATAVIASPSAAPKASASASASAPPRPPPPTRLTAADLPEVESPTPKLNEWSSGKRIIVDGMPPGGCEATLVREWIRLYCGATSEPTGALHQVAGDPKGVFVFVLDTGSRWRDGSDASIVFPLRRGDDRVFQFFKLQRANYGAWTELGPLFEARWTADEAEPRLVMR
ncbi:MAG: hypothetical protein U0414_42090 [Polyangiaceae bacterium]